MADRLYRLLLLALPASLRREFGEASMTKVTARATLGEIVPITPYVC